jgi:4-hydroxy-tetrahydrodipicolinate synthase
MTQSELQECLRGISAVMITPFDDDTGAVDLAGVQATAEFLVAGGMKSIVPLGNTGEFYGLTAGEARAVVEATVAAVAGRAAVVVGVGLSPVEAGIAAEHAGDVGADAVMVHQPANPYTTGEGLRAYYDAVSRRSGLPLVPYVKTPSLRLDDLVEVATLPEVAGIKYAVNDLPLFASAVERTRGSAVVWVCGTAETWAPFFFAAGAEGFTSGLVNVTTGPSLALLEALRQGDREGAFAIWARIRPFEELRALHGDGFNVSVVKEAVRQLGRPAGGVRPPASAVGPEESRTISGLLEAWQLAPLTIAG